MHPRRYRLIGLTLTLLLLSLAAAPWHSASAQNPRPAAGPQAAVGSAFNYQGQLQTGSGPVQGSCDFQFSLYDAASAGNQVGSTLQRTASLVDGRFAVELDFGPEAFTGESRWLAIAVRCGSEQSYTTLGSRQALSPVPYALGLRPGATISGSSSGSSAILKVENSATDSGHALWGQSNTGNAVRGSSSKGVSGYFENTDASNASNTLYATTNGQGKAVYGYNSAPSGVTYGVYGQAQSTNGTGVYGYAGGVSGPTYGLYGKSVSPDGYGVYGENLAGSGNSYGVYGYSSGGVGLYARSGSANIIEGWSGISTTDREFYVSNSGDVYADGRYSGTGASLTNTDNNNSNTILSASTTGQGRAVYAYNGANGGTALYGEALGLSGQTYGVYGKSISSGGFGVYGENTSASGGYALYGFSTTGTALYARSNGGSIIEGWGGSIPERKFHVENDGDITAAGRYSGTGATLENTNASNSGNILYASTNGQGRPVSGYNSAPSGVTYGVYGQALSTNGTGVYGEASGVSGNTRGVHGKSVSAFGTGVYGENTSGSATGYGVYGWSSAGAGVYAHSNSGNIIEAWGGSAPERKFYVANNGNVYARGTFNPGSADFAELLPAATGLEPGDVLVIGADGKLARSSQANEPTVVGVYSTKPGILGGVPEDGSTAGKVPLAVVGVVPVKASAENGAIRPGDMLVASATPGHAMRAGASPANGTVIGKALQGLSSGTGVISILVILQ